jgi:lipopolysaccharide transport system ATP-binding protein
MTRTAAHLRNLGKKYLIGADQRRGYRTLRETVTETLGAPLRMIRAGGALGRTKEFWALRDVSFDIVQGETVGIIGRNGAGKSTLLKVLSGITSPSEGRVDLRGRVGSLLEVGTGFHPELTGRDNIYLNGAILGMRKREIARKFDEIVAFSGVEQFLDTPVKRYSSGMRVRLAFAVAAFLEPEILIVDEVLAVGDAEFQSKCLGKMGDIANSGRTVLFVSHNLTAVRSLCSRGVLLEAGTVAMDGPVEDVLSAYMDATSSREEFSCSATTATKRPGTGEARILSASLHQLDEHASASLQMGQGFRLRVKICGLAKMDSIRIAANLYDDFGVRISAVNSEVTSNLTFSSRKGENIEVACELPSVNLCPGKYPISISLLGASVIDHVDSAVTLDVHSADIYGTGRTAWGKTLVYYNANWSVERDDAEHRQSSAA